MSHDATGDRIVSAPDTPSERHHSRERRITSERRVVTMAPSPWRRRKKLRPLVLLSKTTNVVMVLGFAALVMFACWEAQSRDAEHKEQVYRARVRPGGSDTPLPAQAEPQR